MAALFCAFDHSNYHGLISRHLTDEVTMPDSVLTMFQRGAFVTLSDFVGCFCFKLYVLQIVGLSTINADSNWFSN